MAPQICPQLFLTLRDRQRPRAGPRFGPSVAGSCLEISFLVDFPLHLVCVGHMWGVGVMCESIR